MCDSGRGIPLAGCPLPRVNRRKSWPRVPRKLVAFSANAPSSLQEVTPLLRRPATMPRSSKRRRYRTGRSEWCTEKLTPRNKMTNLVDSHEFPTWQTNKVCFVREMRSAKNALRCPCQRRRDVKVFKRATLQNKWRSLGVWSWRSGRRSYPVGLRRPPIDSQGGSLSRGVHV